MGVPNSSWLWCWSPCPGWPCWGQKGTRGTQQSRHIRVLVFCDLSARLKGASQHGHLVFGLKSCGKSLFLFPSDSGDTPLNSPTTGARCPPQPILVQVISGPQLSQPGVPSSIPCIASLSKTTIPSHSTQQLVGLAEGICRATLCWSMAVLFFWCSLQPVSNPKHQGLSSLHGIGLDSLGTQETQRQGPPAPGRLGCLIQSPLSVSCLTLLRRHGAGLELH